MSVMVMHDKGKRDPRLITVRRGGRSKTPTIVFLPFGRQRVLSMYCTSSRTRIPPMCALVRRFSRHLIGRVAKSP